MSVHLVEFEARFVVDNVNKPGINMTDFCKGIM